MITWWQLILDEIVLVAVLIGGISYFNRRSIVDVQRLIADEVKGYLSTTLEDHRNKSAELVGQGVQQQLAEVTEELRVALADVVRAEAAQDVAEVATQAKTDFLSRMSHEIRTPINGIVGSLALLEPSELTQQQAEDLQRAVLSADRLMVVVNEVLDLAQIEADKVEFMRLPFDLVAVCKEAVDSFRPLATEKGLDLVVWFDDLLEPDRIGDQQKIHQILTNLLSNAVKFTDLGQIKLSVNQGYDDQVMIEVEDSGQGISKEQQADLFQPFSTLSVDSKGAGLGLSICRAFVQGMGGEITVESEQWIGSTFRVVLPLSIEVSVFENIPDAVKAKLDQCGLRVLSVDDDEINRRVLQRHLEQLGCQVRSVNDGQQAVKAVAMGQPFDLILMDLLMPEMDGFQATAEIRRLEQEHKSEPVRIVAITASVVGKVEQQCNQAGMDGFLSKPFSRRQLVEVLNESKKDLDE